QQLVDSSAVESTIAQLIGRDGPASVSPTNLPAAPVRISIAPSTPQIPSPRDRRMAREARHVVIVALRLAGLDDLAHAMGPHASVPVAERVKRTLEDIAYKHGAR